MSKIVLNKKEKKKRLKKLRARKAWWRIKAECRRGNVMLLPCNHIDLTQLIQGTGICSHDGKKCVIVKVICKVWSV